MNSRQLSAAYGEWAVITGASSGIGRAMALQLAEGGLHVALVARSKPELAQLAAQIEAAGKVKALAVPADLATAAGTESVIEAMGELNVGLLVNAAGFGSLGNFLEADAEDAAGMVAVNCTAVLRLTQAFGKRFVAQRRGGVLMMSSIVAFQGGCLSANYSATKAYVQSLSEALAEEWAGTGVDIVASAPGPTQSSFAARAGMKFGQAVAAEDVARESIAALGKKRFVVPGLLSKVLYVSLMTVPRFVRVKIMKLVFRGMR